MGNSDAHREPQVVGLPQTVVLAEDLTRHAILDGIRAGRSYLAESSAVHLTLTVSDERGRHSGIGERLVAPADTQVTVRAEASGVPAGIVRLITDQGLMCGHTLPSGGDGAVTWQTTVANVGHLRAEIRRAPADGGASGIPGPMAALTNPVFLQSGTSG